MTENKNRVVRARLKLNKAGNITGACDVEECGNPIKDCLIVPYACEQPSGDKPSAFKKKLVKLLNTVGKANASLSDVTLADYLKKCLKVHGHVGGIVDDWSSCPTDAEVIDLIERKRDALFVDLEKVKIDGVIFRKHSEG